MSDLNLCRGSQYSHHSHWQYRNCSTCISDTSIHSTSHRHQWYHSVL